MPKVGDICVDYEIGFTKHYRKFIYCACIECGKERRVVLFEAQPKYTMCLYCSRGDDGRAYTRLYSIWHGMKNRCKRNVKNYGTKGIKVCFEWLISFDTFRDWSLSNGYDDTLTIDRVDSAGDYKPSNCQWITRAENSCRESMKPIEQWLDGEVVESFPSISDASRKTGINLSSISSVCRGVYRSAGGYVWKFKKVL